MKIILFTVGLFLLCSVQESIQDIRDRYDYQNLKSALEFGIADSLHHLSLHGKKYSEEAAKRKLTELMLVESIKNIDKFRALDATLNSRTIQRVVAEALNSPQVQMAYSDIRRDPLAPRVVGTTVMGVTQLITDFVKMLLTRY